MAKILYNSDFGGFGLSYEAVMRYAELAGIKLVPEKILANSYIFWQQDGESSDKFKTFSEDLLDRCDHILIQVVEELGCERASGDCAELKIKEVPDDTLYRIEQYDGKEKVIIDYSQEWKIAR